jgi:hypothetical protein
MRERPAWSDIPVIALYESAREAAHESSSQFAAKLERFDRAGLIESLGRLSSALEESHGNEVGARS